MENNLIPKLKISSVSRRNTVLSHLPMYYWFNSSLLNLIRSIIIVRGTGKVSTVRKTIDKIRPCSPCIVINYKRIVLATMNKSQAETGQRIALIFDALVDVQEPIDFV